MPLAQTARFSHSQPCGEQAAMQRLASGDVTQFCVRGDSFAAARAATTERIFDWIALLAEQAGERTVDDHEHGTGEIAVASRG